MRVSTPSSPNPVRRRLRTKTPVVALYNSFSENQQKSWTKLLQLSMWYHLVFLVRDCDSARGTRTSDIRRKFFFCQKLAAVNEAAGIKHSEFRFGANSTDRLGKKAQKHIVEVLHVNHKKSKGRNMEPSLAWDSQFHGKENAAFKVYPIFKSGFQ